MKTIFAILFLSFVFAAAGVNPSTQTVNTWQLQYHKDSLGDVTHAYENALTWNYKDGIGTPIVRIYDVAGRKVADFSKSLKKEGGRAAGYTAVWDAARAASGPYIVEITAGEKRLNRKVTLLK
jgi:hypothetical protein